MFRKVVPPGRATLFATLALRGGARNPTAPNGLWIGRIVRFLDLHLDGEYRVLRCEETTHRQPEYLVEALYPDSVTRRFLLDRPPPDTFWIGRDRGGQRIAVLNRDRAIQLGFCPEASPEQERSAA